MILLDRECYHLLQNQGCQGERSSEVKPGLGNPCQMKERISQKKKKSKNKNKKAEAMAVVEKQSEINRNMVHVDRGVHL